MAALVTAALVLAWPVSVRSVRRLARRPDALAPVPVPSWDGPPAPQSLVRSGGTSPSWSAGRRPGGVHGERSGWRAGAVAVRRWVDPVRHPRRAVLTSALGGAVAGGLAAGPVAAAVAAGYAVLGARALTGRHRARWGAAARAVLLDQLCAMAADLRAGLPASAVAAGSDPGEPSGSPVDDPSLADPGVRRVRRLSTAVWRLAERTGAPAADLVERIEADARAADRAAAVAGAHAAGARATAVLLTALPLGGIALGYGIGADPLGVLLHTPLGAACAGAALLLQAGGLAWTDRLVRVVP
jgi:tight adherence protein B